MVAFDHYRLIDTLRILRHPGLDRPIIGIEKGGIHAAEALQLARHFMFHQLYYHHVRLAYDVHLSEFIVQWPKTYPTEVEGHMRTSRSESTIYAGFRAAAVGVVFIDPEKKKDAIVWLAKNKKTILSEQMELGQ